MKKLITIFFVLLLFGNAYGNDKKLTIDGLIKLSQVGYNDATIINQIVVTKSTPLLYLTTDEVADLRENKVSDRVIEFLISTSASELKKMTPIPQVEGVRKAKNIYENPDNIKEGIAWLKEDIKSLEQELQHLHNEHASIKKIRKVQIRLDDKKDSLKSLEEILSLEEAGIIENGFLYIENQAKKTFEESGRRDFLKQFEKKIKGQVVRLKGYYTNPNHSYNCENASCMNMLIDSRYKNTDYRLDTNRPHKMYLSSSKITTTTPKRLVDVCLSVHLLSSLRKHDASKLNDVSFDKTVTIEGVIDGIEVTESDKLKFPGKFTVPFFSYLILKDWVIVEDNLTSDDYYINLMHTAYLMMIKKATLSDVLRFSRALNGGENAESE